MLWLVGFVLITVVLTTLLGPLGVLLALAVLAFKAAEMSRNARS